MVELNNGNEILRADDLYHVYETEAVDGNVVGLRGIYIKVNQKEVVSVVGPSGSGKSTLMKCLGGLMTPTAGDIFYEGKSIARLNAQELLHLRQRTVSFVFQDSFSKTSTSKQRIQPVQVIKSGELHPIS